jgi:RNA polymerase sigma-70 factor (ECF subfamily)
MKRSQPGPASFEELYRRTSTDILAYLVRRARSREDAADLLAEVFLVAWRRRHAIPSQPNDRLWLFGIARRQLLAHHRLETRRHAIADQLRAQLKTTPPLERSTTAGQANKIGSAVHEALARIAEIDRELLTLTVWDGLTSTEAAKILGLRPGTARVRLHRARHQLSKQLDPSRDSRETQVLRISPPLSGLSHELIHQRDSRC